MGKFSKRSYQKEIMDDLETGGKLMEVTLKELKIINKVLGGNHVTTSSLNQIMIKYPQKSYSIADIGCGGGDMIKVMANWASRKKINCQFIGIDANPNIIKLAKSNLSEIANVAFETQNVFDGSFLDKKVDIVTCTLFTHHFTDEELLLLLSSFKKKAKLGVVINDLHRHPIAYYSIKLLTALFSNSTMVKNDGPLSVLRSFKKSELANILKSSGISDYEIKWKWAFRWRVTGYIL
ncbi:Methyltransferase domain-containing protein [Aquiflexum balticum DSM 16537]|uniref:Methyltransferase domain-containing protein n=1 Tax=Aquiflexum balticum DSM 16537 TaxID=758820 RepID=A0A1W2H0E4_9BACT|nr:methyltransferase domain-containing protein [Aquiflexum balticum]SMD42112.1 Methyltransferase domain-containing protein [Aquiflexum balticum DSM 16537]